MLIKLVRLNFANSERQAIYRAAKHRARNKEELRKSYAWAREKLKGTDKKIMQELVLSFKLKKVTEENEKKAEAIMQELFEKLLETRKNIDKEKSEFFFFKHREKTADGFVNLHFHIWLDVRKKNKDRVLFTAKELRKIQLEMYKKYDPEMYEKLVRARPGTGEKRTPTWILQLKKEVKELQQENEEIKEKARKVLEYAQRTQELLEKEKQLLKEEATFELQIEELEKQLEHIEKAIKQKEKELQNAKKSFLKRILGQAKELETELKKLRRKAEIVQSDIESAELRLKELQLKRKKLLNEISEQQGFYARPMQQAPSPEVCPESPKSPRRALGTWKSPHKKHKLKLKN